MYIHFEMIPIFRHNHRAREDGNVDTNSRPCRIESQDSYTNTCSTSRGDYNETRGTASQLTEGDYGAYLVVTSSSTIVLSS